VHAPEGAGEWSLEQSLEVLEGPAWQAIDVGDQLRLILHQGSRNPNVAIRDRQCTGFYVE
jgi:hypothetical protein